jgi:dienelactone hydrolase
MNGLERVDYRDDATPLTGWLAKPAATARAAILVLPTIANPTPAVERRAHMLAASGYLAMIADFYGPAGEESQDWQALAADLRADVDVYRARLDAALRTLRERPEAAGLPLAAIGYCMGGQAALEIARAGSDIFAAVSFHGLLETGRRAAAGSRPKARVLVCHGDADPLVPRRQVIDFWEEMDAAGANWHFHSYSGVKHGFTDPGSDARGIPAIAYDASADRQSWSAMMNLFDELLPAQSA